MSVQHAIRNLKNMENPFYSTIKREQGNKHCIYNHRLYYRASLERKMLLSIKSSATENLLKLPGERGGYNVKLQ